MTGHVELKTEPLAPQTFVGAKGLRIVADVGGPDDAPLVSLAHGGGQTRHSWKDTAQLLVEAGYRTVSMDLRGHGDSGWAEDEDYDLPVTAADMESVVRATATGRGVNLVGASWGGLSSLVAFSHLRDLDVRSIVLVDVVPRVGTRGSGRIQGFMRAHLDGFASLDEAAEAVAAYRSGHRKPNDAAGLLKNLRQGEDGRFHWHWDPARLKRNPPVDVALVEGFAAKVTCPVLLVRGGHSDIVTDEGIAKLRALIPQLEVTTIEDADHMVVGDDNNIFATGLIEYLGRVSPLNGGTDG
ncbi:MAG: alpha/beta hydrolase [Novosphingobium sp.]